MPDYTTHGDMAIGPHRPIEAAAHMGGMRFLVLIAVCALSEASSDPQTTQNGQEVRRFIHERFGVDPGRGTYIHLNGLIDRGFVETEPVAGPSNDYQPTAAGVEVVRAVVQSVAELIGGA